MNRSINLSEKNLKTDIRDISREFVHELFLICRKAGIYSVDHPMIVKSISKPFMGLQRIFGFKKYFSLYLIEGRLYANNILITDAGAVNYLKDKMYDLEIQSILFEEHITTDDFMALINRFVARISPTHPDFSLDSFIERRRISTILINDNLADTLFNAGLRYREGQCEDYSVRRLVADYFSGDLDMAVTLLTKKYENTEKQARESGIDYHQEIIGYLLPEKFSQLSPSDLIAMAVNILNAAPTLDLQGAEQLSRLITSFDYHPRRNDLVDRIQKELLDREIEDTILKSALSAPAVMKMEVAQDIDAVLTSIFSDHPKDGAQDNFHDCFMRLLRTRQMGKAASVADLIVSHLASENALFRQYALIMLKDIINDGISVNELDFLDVILGQIKGLFTKGLETFEFSEISIFLIRLMIAHRRHEAVADFLVVIGSSRRIEDGVTIFDTVMIRRIFEDLNDREIISFLIREVYQTDNRKIKATRDILSSIQSEEVALQLAQIIAHPNRQVRQHCLKILADLGRPAVNIFSEIIRDEGNFHRPAERRELPDEKWYLIRNAIFVLGNLKDSEACHALRLRLSDSDVRVRMEIVRALEKIGGDDAMDLLMVLAEDIDGSIREAAIIALGLFKNSDLFAFFVDLLKRQKNEITRIINAIAQIGTEEAFTYLSETCEDKERLKELASGKASVSDIKKMIATAMEKFGNENTQKRAEELKESTTNNLTKTATLLLSKFSPNK